jgi:formate dehydrogenase
MNSSLAVTSGIIGHDERQDSVEINRAVALAAGIGEGDRLELRSGVGTLSARALLSDAIRTGTVVMVQGWGSPVLDPASSAEVSRRGNERNKLVRDADLDPLSAVPRLDGTLVSITAAP